MPTALVVTDSNWVLNDVEASLAVASWEISSIDDPRTVAESVAGSPPDVVIVDMQVGSMGGMAVIRAIRGAVDPHDLPRLVLLLDRSADRFIAKRALADTSVLKPFSGSELREAVAPALVGSSEEE